MKLWMIIPVLGAVAVLTVMGERLLVGDPSERDALPSPLVDRDVPNIELPGLDGGTGLTTADLKAPGVKLVNIWASWCVPCRTEHEYLMALANEGVTIHGINYKDAPDNAKAFLAELGSPYKLIGADRDGRQSIDFGVYGVPETFVIDGQGKIRYKMVGPILERNIDKVRAAIKAAQ